MSTVRLAYVVTTLAFLVGAALAIYAGRWVALVVFLVLAGASFALQAKIDGIMVTRARREDPPHDGR